MSRSHVRLFRLLAVGTLSALLCACGAGATAPPRSPLPSPSGSPVSGAYFEVRTAPSEAPFVVLIVDADTIRKARALAGTATPTLTSGIIVATPASYNPNWSFYLRPDSVRMPEIAVEVCDATATMVQQHLSEVGGSFLPGNEWCPGTQVLREISP